jgi:hypothetical protein
MSNAGRPRITVEEYEARLRAYCGRYGVQPTSQGLPPFPAGQRESAQHREWMSLYKALNRLARRQRGQCERCESSASDGSVHCEAHRAANSARAGAHGASVEQRRQLFVAQEARCPICLRAVDLWDSLDHCHSTGRLRAIVHQACNQLLAAAESLGADALDRARAYLWPTSPPSR